MFYAVSAIFRPYNDGLKNDRMIHSVHVYVDDFVLCYESKNINSIERQLQLCLQKIQNWADENGFKFPKQKQRASIFAPNVNTMMILVHI